VHLFFPWASLLGQLEHLFHRCPLPFHPFFNSCVRPPPFFSLLLRTMPHGSRSVTTSLDCVGAPTVAVLCESDCPSTACVVQSERKKNKRVSVIVGNRKVPQKSANVGSVSTLIVERLMDDVLSDVEATFLALQTHADTGSLCFESTTPRDARRGPTVGGHLRWPRLQWGCDICQNLSKLTTLTKFDSSQQRGSSNARSKPVNAPTYGTKTSMPMQLLINVLS
jgi:hypothetical protein